jgi:hypothetical protein
VTPLITRGVKAASCKKLITLAAANARRELAAGKKEARAIANQIDVAQVRFRSAFRKELEKHPDGKAVRKECDDAIKAIQRMAKSLPPSAPEGGRVGKELDSIRKTLSEIERQHGVMLRKAAQRALRRRDYLGAILKTFEKRGRIELKERRYAGLAMRFIPDWAEWLDDLELWQPPPQTSFILEPPFDVEATVTETFSALAGYNSANADVNGRVSISANAPVAGYQMARGQLGAFLTLPPGFSTLKLQARITDAFASVTAFAIGASWASSGGITEVTSITDNATTRRETSINYVTAPVIFYAQDTFEGAHIVNAEFDISDQGGEVLVTAGLKCDTWGAGLAAGVASGSGVVLKITIEIS